MDLRKYVSLMKNLRGILVFDPDELTAETVSRIARFHRYRKVGLLDELADACDSDVRRTLEKSCFVRIGYPDTSFEALHAELGDETPLRVLLLSSIYISPLFIAEGGRQLVRRFETLTIETRQEVSLTEVLRHIRIAAYSQIDFHDAMTEGAVRALESGSVDEEISIRREWARKDRDTRFWRLFQHSDDGRPEICDDSREGEGCEIPPHWVGGYYDILLAEHIMGIRGLVTPMTAIALGMVLGFTVLTV